MQGRIGSLFQLEIQLRKKNTIALPEQKQEKTKTIYDFVCLEFLWLLAVGLCLIVVPCHFFWVRPTSLLPLTWFSCLKLGSSGVNFTRNISSLCKNCVKQLNCPGNFLHNRPSPPLNFKAIFAKFLSVILFLTAPRKIWGKTSTFPYKLCL